MIRQKIKIEKYDWEIYAYYAISSYYIDEILEHLWEIGVDGEDAIKAYENLSENKLDTGLCYSNYAKRKSIIVIAKTSSAREFLNSLTHEASHACVHIASAQHVNMKSEEFAYMVGDLCMDMYPKIKHLLCECCRNKNKTKQYYDYEREN